MVHLEFTVAGPPVSHQTADRARLKAWQAAVRTAAAAVWIGPLLTGRLKLTVINFHDDAAQLLDNDNMAKPIPDALEGLVLEDDRQIRYSELIQVLIDAPHRPAGASPVVLAPFPHGRPFVYVRVEDAPEFLQLPEAP